MNAAKPPSRAWMVSQRAGRSLALRSEWATSGGLTPDLEGQFTFEDVERIGVLVVHVRGGDLFTR